MSKVQIFIQGQGRREIGVLDLPAHATVRDLIDAAQARGFVSHGSDRAVSVFREDAEGALPPDATLESAGLGDKSSVHLSRCVRIAVTVHFNGAQRAETFGPGVPMHRVKAWAVGKQGFDLSPVDAAEHVLQITGTQERPDEDVHIGVLAQPSNCAIEFDLVAKVRVEG